MIMFAEILFESVCHNNTLGNLELSSSNALKSGFALSFPSESTRLLLEVLSVPSMSSNIKIIATFPLEIISHPALCSVQYGSGSTPVPFELGLSGTFSLFDLGTVLKIWCRSSLVQDEEGMHRYHLWAKAWFTKYGVHVKQGNKSVHSKSKQDKRQKHRSFVLVFFVSKWINNHKHLYITTYRLKQAKHPRKYFHFSTGCEQSLFIRLRVNHTTIWPTTLSVSLVTRRSQNLSCISSSQPWMRQKSCIDKKFLNKDEWMHDHLKGY